jgi:hypothetical protein
MCGQRHGYAFINSRFATEKVRIIVNYILHRKKPMQEPVESGRYVLSQKETNTSQTHNLKKSKIPY